MRQRNSRKSAASLDKDLQSRLPESLRTQAGVSSPFEHARCPLNSMQLNDLNKTEAERRGEQGGSNMIKLHKPFPDLKPKNHQSVVRQHFNQQWLREQREARMQHYVQEAREALQRQAYEQNLTQDYLPILPNQ